jgi:hypothetical protein
MPNMDSDGLIDEAILVHRFSDNYTNPDFNLQNAVATAIANAAATGVYTTTVATAAYANVLVQLMIKRLVDMGYTATLSGTTLTVNW